MGSWGEARINFSPCSASSFPVEFTYMNLQGGVKFSTGGNLMHCEMHQGARERFFL